LAKNSISFGTDNFYHRAFICAVDKTKITAGMPAERLFFFRCDAVAGEFAIGALAVSRLFTHGFPADLILTGFTDAAFQDCCGFGAHHAFFCRLAHGFSNALVLSLVNPAL
jgi:hypothetical protein